MQNPDSQTVKASLSLPQSKSAENALTHAAAPVKSPVVLFEWQLPPAPQPGEEADETTESPLRWLGDIEGHLGYAQGEFRHTFEAWCEVLHPDDLSLFLNATEFYLRGDEPSYEMCRAKRADGTWLRFVYAGVASFDGAGNPYKLTGTLANFTILDERGQEPNPRQREQQEKARAESLLRTASVLNAQLNLQAVCDSICEEAGRTIGAPSAVMLFNKSRDAFVPAAVRGMPKDYDKRYTPTMRSIYERHVEEMGPLFLFTDAQATPDLPNHKLYLEVDMRTIGIASLIREGEVLGLLKVYSFGETRTFDENELALLQGLADQGAQAISNARFFDEAQRRLSNIQSLRQIDLAILTSNEVTVSLNVVLDQLESRMCADAGSILLLNESTHTLHRAADRGFRSATLANTNFALGQGLAGRAALKRCLLHVPDLRNPEIINFDCSGPEFSAADLNAFPHANTESTAAETVAATLAQSGGASVLSHEGFVSYYAVPLIASGKVKGVLELWYRSPVSLGEEEQDFLETLAGQAAIAVENANLFRDEQRAHEELILAYNSTLEGWSRALDLRDKETEGHSQRVTAESLRLAAKMGLSDAELLQIRRGALLHDIGKVGIPDSILLKPGPLTDEEWVIMKKHPSYALELLSPVAYLRPALDIPYSHHEKWDGSGYPQGLRGEQIPLSARIFSVVDVWDALSSDRPYRKGWPLQRVLKHIRDGAGSHFDPQVVENFLQLYPPIEEDESST